MDRKRLLIIGAGEEQVPAYKIALTMGLTVVGSDINPNAPGFHLTGEKIIASTYDAEETLREVLKFNEVNPIHGVMTLACDTPVAVALVAKELGLKGNTIHTAKLSSDKLLQLRRFRLDNIPIPDYKEIQSVEELKSTIDDWGLPVILKPPDNRGARGVLRLADPVHMEWAFRESASNSAKGSIIVQKFIPGNQISSESIVVSGKAYTAMYSGRNYGLLEKYAPYVIENGGCLPADITESQEESLDDIVQRAAASLGIEDGPLKGDLVLTDKGPVVLEFASRMGGGYAVSHSIPLTHGVNLIEQVIRQALGEQLSIRDLHPAYKQSAAIRFFFPDPGVVKEIKGFDNLGVHDGVVLKRLYIKKGDTVPRITDHTKRAGCVIAVGKSKKEAEQRAISAINAVLIVTEQQPSGKNGK